MELHQNYLPETQRKQIYDWIHNNEYLDDDYNGKRCFAVTYKKEDLPDFLKFVVTGNYNIYNFVGFYTFKGFHKDFMIFLPETEVYYVDICPDMKGGEIIVDNVEFKPKTNSSITLPKKTKHSVNAILEQTKYRTTLVCEKYFILKKYLDKLDTPWYHKG